MKKSLLREMKPGEKARIISMPDSRRLNDLGLTKGTIVECVPKAPFGDPKAFRIRGAVIASRSCDCGGIETEEIK